ncbi:PadR family transcriptional regulator [Amycolatopsis minnesotensis]|uniref:PadR family transcriptional regulator n=1 Tax=Amycolatopsis minnesotensis TaxID=337894 RepID=A0ABN2RVF3_9PSEU
MAPPKLTPLALAVLELLHEKPMHPYEIAQLMRDRCVDNRVNIKPGSLYHTVDRLLGAEYIRVVDTQRDGRRPERTVYGMTDEGRAAFVARGIAILGTVADERPEYASGLAVIDDLAPDVVIEQLTNRAMKLKATIASFRVYEKRLQDEEVPEIYWVDWRFTVARTEFELTWTEQLIDDIRSGRLEWQHADRHRTTDLHLVHDEDAGKDKGNDKTG